MLASRLMEKDFKGFWDEIKCFSNDKTTGHARTVGGCSSADSIASMWKDHFEELYNSVNVEDSRDKFLKLISDVDDMYNNSAIKVNVVVEAVHKQKGKAAGLDGIHIEAFIHGCSRLRTHISLLFNLFVKCCYLLKTFISSVIVPLVKCKTKDMSDVNNYRAIAISSSISKLFKSVIMNEFRSTAEGDELQFG